MWPFGRPNVGRLAARRDVAGLARALGHGDPAIRRAAAAALAGCEPTAAAPALLGALADPVEEVRRAAQAALVGLDSPLIVAALAERLAARPDEAPALLAVLARLGARDEARRVLEAALSAAAPATRVAAARALGRRGDARAVAPLIRALTDPVVAVVEAAAAALVVVGPDRALDPLAAVLADGAPAARAAAAGILGRQSDPRALAPLARALGDPDAATRAAALAALGQLPEPGRQLAVLAGLSTDPVERERGAQRLRQIGTLPPLAAALRAIDHPGLRAAAARAIGRLGEAGTVDALAGALDDPHPAVRQEAAWMLGVTGQAGALAPLLTALASGSDAAPRATAARALGRLGDPAALPALEVAAGDADPAVAAAAERAATSLRGASAARADAPAAILQIVLVIEDPAPADHTTYVAALLDRAGADGLPLGAVSQIVTLAPSRPLLSPAEALMLARRQFRSAPPGYQWEVMSLADETGRPALALRLVAVG